MAGMTFEQFYTHFSPKYESDSRPLWPMYAAEILWNRWGGDAQDEVEAENLAATWTFFDHFDDFQKEVGLVWLVDDWTGLVERLGDDYIVMDPDDHASWAFVVDVDSHDFHQPFSIDPDNPLSSEESRPQAREHPEDFCD